MTGEFERSPLRRLGRTTQRRSRQEAELEGGSISSRREEWRRRFQVRLEEEEEEESSLWVMSIRGRAPSRPRLARKRSDPVDTAEDRWFYKFPLSQLLCRRGGGGGGVFTVSGGDTLGRVRRRVGRGFLPILVYVGLFLIGCRAPTQHSRRSLPARSTRTERDLPRKEIIQRPLKEPRGRHCSRACHGQEKDQKKRSSRHQAALFVPRDPVRRRLGGRRRRDERRRAGVRRPKRKKTKETTWTEEKTWRGRPKRKKTNGRGESSTGNFRLRSPCVSWGRGSALLSRRSGEGSWSSSLLTTPASPWQQERTKRVAREWILYRMKEAGPGHDGVP